jgi:hypothetical protein
LRFSASDIPVLLLIQYGILASSFISAYQTKIRPGSVFAALHSRPAARLSRNECIYVISLQLCELALESGSIVSDVTMAGHVWLSARYRYTIANIVPDSRKCLPAVYEISVKKPMGL